MTALPPPPPPLSQGLDPALSCTYIILVVAILLIIGQLINRFYDLLAFFPHALILR